MVGNLSNVSSPNKFYFQTDSDSSTTVIFHNQLLSLLKDYNVSTDCRNDMLQVNIGLENGEDWALRRKYYKDENTCTG